MIGMRRGFFDGLLAGALAGIFVGTWLIPGTKQKRQVSVLKKGRIIGQKAGRLLAETRDAMGEVRGVIAKRLKH